MNPQLTKKIELGHTRTIEAHSFDKNASPPLQKNLTVADKPIGELPTDEELVRVDGTKVRLSLKLIKQAEKTIHPSVSLKVPKKAFTGPRKRRVKRKMDYDYLKTHAVKTANRRCTDPILTFSTLLEEIVKEMREPPDFQPFVYPVNRKEVPDYYQIVTQPMDLQTIRETIRQKRYHFRQDFLFDVYLIVHNSVLYNGENHSITFAAKRMMEVCITGLSDKEEELMRLEKAINPLLDDNAQVAFSYVLENIINGSLKKIPESAPFLKPVNKKLVVDYYEIIKNPMDLEAMANKVKEHRYQNRQDFLNDMDRMVENSITYNGEESHFTEKAKRLGSICRHIFEKYDPFLTQLETRISTAQPENTERGEECCNKVQDDTQEGFDDEHLLDILT